MKNHKERFEDSFSKKTALVLSGGGSRGGYEIGVWEALRELGIGIDMVFGTSVGAINAAMIAQGDLELSKNLWLQMETDMIFDINDAKDEIPAGVKDKLADRSVAGMPAENALAYAKEIVLSGGAGSTGLLGLLNKYVKEESVRSSGLIYGLVATEFPGLKGHFMTLDDIPPGKLVDYIMASASCFPAVQKCVIGDLTFIDGGYSDNMPVEMAMSFGAERIIAVNLEAAGIVRHETVKRASREVADFRVIKSSHDLGSFLLFDKANTARMMRLGYLDTMKSFGEYDGSAYTFEKGDLDRHKLLGAENAASILKLDPTVVYNAKSIVVALADKLEEYGKSGAGAAYSSYGLEGDSCDCENGSQNSGLRTERLPTKELISRIKNDLSDGDFRIFLLHYIALGLKKYEADSIYLKPPLFTLLEGDIKAANYLIQQGLL